MTSKIFSTFDSLGSKLNALDHITEIANNILTYVVLFDHGIFVYDTPGKFE